MGRLRCPCGTTLSDVASPSQFKHWMVSDPVAEEIDEDLSYVALCYKAKEVWECPDCGRLGMFDPGRNDGCKWYKPE